MARRVAVDNEDDDWEGGDWYQVCPYCAREIPEDVPRCPYCENYVSDEDAPRKPKPWWILLGVILCLYVVYRWVVP